jgi:hypothetical protein
MGPGFLPGPFFDREWFAGPGPLLQERFSNRELSRAQARSYRARFAKETDIL